MSILSLDKENIWHPFTQSYGSSLPIPIVRAEGLYLFTENGEKIIDAISSWWTSVHGHCNPYIAKAIFEQATTLDHVIFAGFTHPKAVELSQKVLSLLPSNFSKVFFSDDGSTSVEVAIKMGLQYWFNKGIKKTRIIALKDSYHGDTFGAMAVGERSAFTQAFDPLMFHVDFIQAPFPGQEKQSLDEFKAAIKDDTALFIFEPLLMGTAGMKMYAPEALDELIQCAKSKNVLCIADEVLTGFYRTGKCFAIDHLKEQVDIVCLSKGITGGVLPLGVTVCTQNIFDAFVSEDKFKTFFHGHSYTGNAIICAAVCANIELLSQLEVKNKITNLSAWQKEWSDKMNSHPALIEARNIGTIAALEVRTASNTSYFNSLRDKIYNHFISRNILLRPLGNVIYILPPYCITKDELNYIYSEISLFLNQVHEENR
jgi:adenosylmethionine-8-amino-7-oxononanoate aminotransferase